MTALKEAIGRAMMRRFEYAYTEFDENYNPDTAWDAVDEVIAVLVEELTGQTASVKRNKKVIGSYGIELSPEVLR